MSMVPSGREFTAPTPATPGSVESLSRVSWWNACIFSGVGYTTSGRSTVSVTTFSGRNPVSTARSLMKAFHHQAGAGQQDQRERDLSHDQRGA